MPTVIPIDEALAQAQRVCDGGHFYEADLLYHQLLDDVPEDSETFLAALRGRAVALYGLGRFHDGEQQLRRVLVACTAEPEGERGVDALGRLAEAVGEQGRWIEAEALARDAARRGESALGRRHEATLSALLALAWVRSSTAPAQSERWIREIREAIGRALGRSHPLTWSAQHLLVTTLHSLGRWDDAEQAARSLVVARTRHQGADHPHTLRARCDLALILHAAGSHAEAVALAQAVLADCERALGDHPYAVHIRRDHEVITRH